MKAASGCPSKRSRIAGRLHLRALAVRRLDLEGRARLREDRAHAERAVFLEEDLLHAAYRRAQSTMLGDALGKRHQRVVAAAHHLVQRARVEVDRLAVVEHLVAGLDEEPVALRARDRGRVQRAQLVDVLLRELERFAGVEVASAGRGSGAKWRCGCTAGLSSAARQPRRSASDRGVEAAERAAHQREVAAATPRHASSTCSIARAGRWCSSGTR